MPNRFRRTVTLQRGRYIRAVFILKADKDGWTTSFAQMRQTPTTSRKLGKQQAEELFEHQLQGYLNEGWVVIGDEQDTY